MDEARQRDMEALRALQRDSEQGDSKFVKLEERLDALRKIREKFDPIGTLDLWGREDTHSRLLHWLFNPNGSHHLGACFLHRFLERVGFGREESENWADSKALRERNKIDILIVNKSCRALLAIENKWRSGEHGTQLKRNEGRIDRKFPRSKYCHHLVLLTPHGDHPKGSSLWTPIGYRVVLECIDAIIHDTTDDSARDAEIRRFLQQYAAVLEEAVLVR